MKHPSNSAIALTAILVAMAQPPALARAQSADTMPMIDSAAIAALDRMGAYLRTLKAMDVKATITTEEVLPDGQKVQLGSAAQLVAESPDRLRLDLISDRQQRLFLYDGKTFTLYAPRSNFYATVAAPATIVELATQLEDKYAIELPLVDLFRWGTPESSRSGIKAAAYIGPSVVDGITVEQYAFRQEGLDWQLWIQEGDHPLPRKLVLTTTTDDARPQHTAIYAWNLAPSVNANAYTFVAPADAAQITIAEVVAERPTTKKPGGPK